MSWFQNIHKKLAAFVFVFFVSLVGSLLNGCGDENSVEARKKAAEIALDDDDCDEALSITTDLVTDVPNDPDVYQLRSSAYMCKAGFSIFDLIEEFDDIGEGGEEGQELTEIANILSSAFAVTSLTDPQVDENVRLAVTTLTNAPAGVLRAGDYIQEAAYALMALAKRFVLYGDTSGNDAIDDFDSEFVPAYQAMLDNTCTSRTSTGALFDTSGVSLYDILDDEDGDGAVSCTDLIDDVYDLGQLANTALANAGLTSGDVFETIDSIFSGMDDQRDAIDVDFLEISQCVQDPDLDATGDPCVQLADVAGDSEVTIHFGEDADNNNLLLQATPDGLCDAATLDNPVFRINTAATNDNIDCLSDFDISSKTIGTAVYLSCDFGTGNSDSEDPANDLLGSASTLATDITTSLDSIGVTVAITVPTCN